MPDPHLKIATRAAFTTAVALSVITSASCARSSSGGASTPQSPASTSVNPSARSSTAKGDFGTLKGICGPGNAMGATSRGVTNTTIHLATNADAGAAAAPGLGQEFFDVAAGFTKWCNAAGGVNGRKIVLDKLDAKLFDVGQMMITACQSDFMMIGGGNPVDAAGVKPREACKLGYMPAYDASTEASGANYQVAAYPLPANKSNLGGTRLLTELYPASKTQGVAIGGLNIASLVSTTKKIHEAMDQLDIKVTTVQAKPPTVTNFRPYMEELKGNGSAGLYETGGTNLLPEIQSMSDVGYKPSWLQVTPQFYNTQTVKAANSTPFPSTYSALQHLPFELSHQYPVMAEAKSIITSATPGAQLDDYDVLSLNAWLLWAKSATACGSTLTVDCVISKGGSETAWTAGGMFPSADLKAGEVRASPCVLIMRLTPSGWVYDKQATKPDSGPFNCDPQNLRTVKTYQ